jgi:hypothetical protein
MHIKKIVVRIFLEAILFLSIFVLPWWAVVMGAIIIFLLFQAPEVIVIGVFLDALYGGSIFTVEFAFTIFFLLLFLVSRFLRQYIIIFE